jgi:hypothetical protein
MIVRILIILAAIYLLGLIVSFIFFKIVPGLIGLGILCALYLATYKKFK